jgi:hypothetical protein
LLVVVVVVVAAAAAAVVVVVCMHAFSMVSHCAKLASREISMQFLGTPSA